jgi:hypothetical protein
MKFPRSAEKRYQMYSVVTRKIYVLKQIFFFFSKEWALLLILIWARASAGSFLYYPAKDNRISILQSSVAEPKPLHFSGAHNEKRLRLRLISLRTWCSRLLKMSQNAIISYFPFHVFNNFNNKNANFCGFWKPLSFYGICCVKIGAGARAASKIFHWAGAV